MQLFESTPSISTPSILHLTLKKQWFDRILSGRKKYEFREAKAYWKKRLENRRYDVILFKNGYNAYSPIMEVEFTGLQKRKFKGNEYYCISLGKIIKSTNVEITPHIKKIVGDTI